MNLYNLPCISAVGGNMGFGNCSFDLKNAKEFMITPAGTKVAASALTTFIATAQTNLRLDDKYQRWQKVTGIKGVAKANVEAATATWGDGTTQETRPERIGRTYDFKNLCAFLAVATLHGMDSMYDIWPIYDGNVIQGTKTTMSDSEPGVKGFSLATIRVLKYTEAINETQAMWQFNFELAEATEWDNMVIIQPEDGTLKSLESMQTISLEWVKVTPPVAGSYHVKATASCGRVNMAEVFATELADAALWKVTNATTGAAITVEGVTISGLGNFVLALDDTDTDFTGATKLKITMVAPSLLDAADVSWYEATVIVIPK